MPRVVSVYWNHKKEGNWQLDLDHTQSPHRKTGSHEAAENIYWNVDAWKVPTKEEVMGKTIDELVNNPPLPPQGKYTVAVENFENDAGAHAKEYQLNVFLDGRAVPLFRTSDDETVRSFFVRGPHHPLRRAHDTVPRAFSS